MYYKKEFEALRSEIEPILKISDEFINELGDDLADKLRQCRKNSDKVKCLFNNLDLIKKSEIPKALRRSDQLYILSMIRWYKPDKQECPYLLSQKEIEYLNNNRDYFMEALSSTDIKAKIRFVGSIPNFVFRKMESAKQRHQDTNSAAGSNTKDTNTTGAAGDTNNTRAAAILLKYTINSRNPDTYNIITVLANRYWKDKPSTLIEDDESADPTIIPTHLCTSGIISYDVPLSDDNESSEFQNVSGYLPTVDLSEFLL